MVLRETCAAGSRLHIPVVPSRQGLIFADVALGCQRRVEPIAVRLVVIVLDGDDAELEFAEIKVLQDVKFAALSIYQQIVNICGCAIGLQKIQERYGLNSIGGSAHIPLGGFGAKRCLGLKILARRPW